jgi:hypothetical protein
VGEDGLVDFVFSCTGEAGEFGLLVFEGKAFCDKGGLTFLETELVILVLFNFAVVISRGFEDDREIPS